MVAEMVAAPFVGGYWVMLLASAILRASVIIMAVDRYPIQIDGRCYLDVRTEQRECKRDTPVEQLRRA